MFSVSDSSQDITATATLVHAQRLAKYAIDGMLYDGQYAFIKQYYWIKIDLPEVLLIRGVKAFSAKVNKSFRYQNLIIKIVKIICDIIILLFYNSGVAKVSDTLMFALEKLIQVLIQVKSMKGAYY